MNTLGVGLARRGLAMRYAECVGVSTVPRATFLLGLCGSGKTHFARRFVVENKATFFVDLLGKQQLPDLVEALKSGQDCIVEEITSCTANARPSLLVQLAGIPNLEVEWICFENDIESANWNVINRPYKQEDVPGHLKINRLVHAVDEIPAGARIIPITRVRK